MKKLIPLFLSTVMLAGFARCEGASDFSQVGNLSANSIMANTINGGSIQLPYSLKYVAGAYTIPAATTYKTNTELNSAGVWTTTVITNTVASHTSTNMIRADRFLGKAGCLVISETNVNVNVYMDAPGAVGGTFRPTGTYVSGYMGTNGVWVTTTHVVAGFTNSTPVACIGQTFALVNGGSQAYVLQPGTTILPAVTTYTQALNSVVLMTPISGTQWKVLSYTP